MKRLGLLLLMASLFAAPLRAQDTEVRSIDFEGAESFDEGMLRAAIFTEQTHCSLFILCLFGSGIDRRYVDEVGLSGDLYRLRMFYYQRGYRDATVTLDSVRTGNKLELQFNIHEGEPVRVASLVVDGAQEIGGALPIAVGEPFSLLAYEEARDTLTSRLANNGYARAEVLANYTIPRDSPSIAHLEYQVFPGERLRFGAIVVEGQQAVSPMVVRRMLTFETGDYYSADDVLRSQRNLFGLETFRHVEIRADAGAATDSLVPVVVQVNEGDLHRVRFGAGLSNSEFLSAEGSWTSRNFLGGARRLEARARVYNVFSDILSFVPVFEQTGDAYNDLSGLVSIDFGQPWFFGPRNSLNTGIYVERRSLPDIFVRNARGAYLTLARSIRSGESFSIGYHPELTELSAGGDLVFCVNFVACGASEIAVLRDPHWLSPIALSYAHDGSNSLFAPTHGSIVRFDAEYAARPTGSDFSYARLLAELTTYHEITRGVVFAARVRPGWARALDDGDTGLGLHPQKRFFGGGSNSVRGFAQFRMGPKLLTTNAKEFLVNESIEGHCTAQEVNAGTCDVAALLDGNESRFEIRPVGGAAILEGNLELRVPFFWNKLRAAAFVDYGQVWRQSSDVNLDDVVITPGFGFRYFSAIGPIRVDVGYNPHPAERLSVISTKLVCSDAQTCASSEIEPGKTYHASQLANTDELVTLGTVLWGAKDRWQDRFQLHFSIGQAF